MADRLADPDLYQHGDPWTVWHALRAAGGAAWTRERDGPGFWSVTRYSDCRHLLAQWEDFRSEPGTTLEGDRWRDDPAAGQMLPLMDPPGHGALRGALAGEFAAGRLAALAASFAGEIERPIAQAAEQGGIDLDAALAVPLPARLSLKLLGLPDGDSEGLLPIIRGTLSCDETERAIADAELILYLNLLIQDCRRRPRDDFISRLCAPSGPGRTLSDQALALTAANLLAAGLTTTRLAINGGFEAFARHPGEWRRLRAAPALRKRAVEEVLRWTSPALALARTAVRRVEVAGVSISPGERVVAWLPSANRDEAAFAGADSFRIDRDDNYHLGFGTGIHRCLGMAIARLELGMLIDAAARHWSELDLAEEPGRMRSLVLHGIERLSLVVRRA